MYERAYASASAQISLSFAFCNGLCYPEIELVIIISYVVVESFGVHDLNVYSNKL